MLDISLHASPALSVAILFASDPHRRREPSVDRHRSRGAICVLIAVMCALTVLSGIAAVEYPLSFADIFNQF
jgi:hypothetical protein